MRISPLRRTRCSPRGIAIRHQASTINPIRLGKIDEAFLVGGDKGSTAAFVEKLGHREDFAIPLSERNAQHSASAESGAQVDVAIKIRLPGMRPVC